MIGIKYLRTMECLEQIAFTTNISDSLGEPSGEFVRMLEKCSAYIATTKREDKQLNIITTTFVGTIDRILQESNASDLYSPVVLRAVKGILTVAACCVVFREEFEDQEWFDTVDIWEKIGFDKIDLRMEMRDEKPRIN